MKGKLDEESRSALIRYRLQRAEQTLDEAKTVEDTVEIAVQINGKTKGTIAIAKADPKDEVLAKAKEAIADKLTGNIVKDKRSYR